MSERWESEAPIKCAKWDTAHPSSSAMRCTIHSWCTLLLSHTPNDFFSLFILLVCDLLFIACDPSDSTAHTHTHNHLTGGRALSNPILFSVAIKSNINIYKYKSNCELNKLFQCCASKSSPICMIHGRAVLSQNRAESENSAIVISTCVCVLHALFQRLKRNCFDRPQW